MCVPSWYTRADECFLRACVFSRLSRSFFLSHHSAQTNKTTNRAFCSTKTRRVSSSKSVKSLINYQIYRWQVLFSKEKPDFLRHTDFAFSSLLLRLLSFRAFPFRERERERHFFVSARERANALGRTQRERERFVFNKRKCPPPRNKNGNKMKRLS